MLGQIALGVQELAQQVRRSPGGPLVGLALLLTCLVGLAAAWHLTALADWLAVERIIGFGKMYRGSMMAPVAVVAAFIVGGFLVMPLTLLVAATAVLFGPVLGFVYAFAGAMISAIILFAVGRALGRDAVRRVAGPRLGRVSQRLARHGVAAMALVRLLPLAPFTIVNLGASVSEIRTRDFIMGSALGMAPAIAAMALLGDRVERVLERPDPENIALLVLFGLALLLCAVLLSRWASRQAARRDWGEGA